MAFTDEEIAYIRSQPLARVATVSAEEQPDVVPVGFEFDGFHFFIGGFDPGRTRRTRNVESGQTKVALVIDDLPSTDPWTPRFLRVYGTAEIVPQQRPSGPVPILKITPTISWSMNLDARPLGDHGGELTRTRTVHE